MQKAGVMVVDASGLIAGRLASCVAESLLKGHRVIIVGAEGALLSGARKSVEKERLKKLEISSVVHPRHGPFHPRRPDSILTRMVRGMIPRRKAKGLEAMKRLRVYVSIPEQFKDVNKISFDEALPKRPTPFYLTLGDLALRLGWKG